MQCPRPGLIPCSGQDTFLSQCLSPPRCMNGTSKFDAEGNPTMDKHYIQGGVEILLVDQCYINQDKPQLCGPFGLPQTFKFLELYLLYQD